MTIAALDRPRLTGVLLLVSALALTLATAGCGLNPGTKVAVTDKESVYYSEGATEAQAKALGELLKTQGYFDGKTTKDVLLKQQGGHAVVSFVVQPGIWDKPEMINGFQVLGKALAPSVGGAPITLRLVTDQLDVKKELKIE